MDYIHEVDQVSLFTHLVQKEMSQIDCFLLQLCVCALLRQDTADAICKTLEYLLIGAQTVIRHVL